MPDASRLRDSTQIVVPAQAIEHIRADLEAEFSVTIFEQDDDARIIASPVVIKQVNEFLARHGVGVR